MTKKRILIVEDESLVAMDIHDCIASSYEVVGTASSGQDALLQVENKRPNLVIMDINLEGPMDGAEAALLIRSRFSLPVLFLSAFTDHATLGRARLAQPYGYIVKPFQDRELLANIEMALYRHEQEILFLRNSDWLANTLSAFNDGIILIDHYKNIVFMNARSAELTGWPLGTLGSQLEKTFSIHNGKSNSSLTDSIANEVLSKNTMIDFKEDTLLTRKDGHEIHIDGSITTIVAPDSFTLGAVVVFQDSGRPAKAPNIAMDNDRESNPEHIVEITDDGAISSFNAGAERVFGFKSSEMVGKNIETFIPKPFYSFMHKNGSIYPIHNAINKMRLKERSAFIALLCNLIPQRQNHDSRETGDGKPGTGND